MDIFWFPATAGNPELLCDLGPLRILLDVLQVIDF